MDRRIVNSIVVRVHSGEGSIVRRVNRSATVPFNYDFPFGLIIASVYRLSASDVMIMSCEDRQYTNDMVKCIVIAARIGTYVSTRVVSNDILKRPIFVYCGPARLCAKRCNPYRSGRVRAALYVNSRATVYFNRR